MRGRDHRILGDVAVRRVAAIQRMLAQKEQSLESIARGVKPETWKKNRKRDIAATIANLPKHMQTQFA